MNDELIEARAALAAIETLVGGDQGELWEMEKPRLRGRSRQMQEVISLVYCIAHASQHEHSCYHVHTDWRAKRDEIAASEREEHKEQG